MSESNKIESPVFSKVNATGYLGTVNAADKSHAEGVRSSLIANQSYQQQITTSRNAGGFSLS